MEGTAITIAALATAVALGANVFVSSVLAPAVFKSLDPAGASRFLRTMFPRYYVLVLVTGLAALASLVVGGADFGGIVLAAILATLAAISLGLVPAINAARDAGAAAAARFKRLHLGSVLLNVVMLGVSAWLVWRLTA